MRPCASSDLRRCSEGTSLERLARDARAVSLVLRHRRTPAGGRLAAGGCFQANRAGRSGPRACRTVIARPVLIAVRDARAAGLRAESKSTVTRLSRCEAVTVATPAIDDTARSHRVLAAAAGHAGHGQCQLFHYDSFACSTPHRGRGAELRRSRTLLDRWRADRAEAQRRVHRIRAFRAELEALDRRPASSPLTPEQRHADRRLPRPAPAAALPTASRRRSHRRRPGSCRAACRSRRSSRPSRLTAAIYSLVVALLGTSRAAAAGDAAVRVPADVARGGVELSARRERTLYVASIFALVAFGTYWLAVGELSRAAQPAVDAVRDLGRRVLRRSRWPCRMGFASFLPARSWRLLVALAGSVFQAAGMPWTLRRRSSRRS